MIVGLLIGIVLGAVLNGILIWIVGRLGLGLHVTGPGPALTAGLLVSVLNGLFTFVWTTFVGYEPASAAMRAILTLLIAAVVLQIAGDRVRGMKVDGFTGALVAAVAMAVFAYLLATMLTGMAV